jgi:nucleotide-binding universal stress UspA family protein
MKILVPYDGSGPSEKAISQALELAQNLKETSQITILNVVQEVLIPPLAFGGGYLRSKITGEQLTSTELAKELCQSLKVEASQMLSRVKDNITTKQKTLDNVTINTQVLVGYVADKIVEYASNENVDLIIIGNIGLGGISKLKCLGSVSRAVSERAKCPVMIVH